MSKKKISSKKILNKVIPTPILETDNKAIDIKVETSSTVDVSKVLNVIASKDNTPELYKFLQKDLELKIDALNRNSIYWKSQIGYYENSKNVKNEISNYKRFIKQNKKSSKQYKKALVLLKKAKLHFSKGIDS